MLLASFKQGPMEEYLIPPHTTQQANIKISSQYKQLSYRQREREKRDDFVWVGTWNTTPQTQNWQKEIGGEKINPYAKQSSDLSHEQLKGGYRVSFVSLYLLQLATRNEIEILN